jgi:trk system potassium uptake protein
MSARARDSAVLVVGLGRFGSAVAESLVAADVEVLAVDSDPRLVKEWADRLTQVVEGDTTDADMLRQIGAAELGQAVVAIGTSVEASVLTVSHLSDLGVPVIWAKALSPAHGRILERVGATRIVYPEREVGAKTARLLADNLLDYLPVGDDHALAAAPAPQRLWGLTLAEARTRTNDDVTVVAVRRVGGAVENATAETVIQEGDTIVLLGSTKSIARLAAR